MRNVLNELMPATLSMTAGATTRNADQFDAAMTGTGCTTLCGEVSPMIAAVLILL